MQTADIDSAGENVAVITISDQSIDLGTLECDLIP